VIERKRLLGWLLAVAGLGAVACASKGAAPGQGAGKIVAKVLPAARPEGRVHFEEGLRQLAAGPASYQAAREAFIKATRADPQLFEAWHDLGLVEAKQGRYDEAVKSLARALSLQPASRRTAVAFGDALVRAGRAADAADLFRKRVDAAPEDLEMRLLFIQALREAGKSERALEEAAALLMRDSRNVRGFNALGLVYHRQGKQALAEAALKRALELDPDNADVWNNLGLVAMARGHDRQAFEAWTKASTLDPESVAATLNKAAVLLDCGDYKRARTALQEAARARPEDPEVQVALGVALRGLEQHTEARAAYERALALRADYPPALFNLGVLYMDFLPDKQKAREHLTLYRKLAPARDPHSKEAEARLRELR
jgi:Flp pilus assembly protein TadD